MANFDDNNTPDTLYSCSNRYSETCTVNQQNSSYYGTSSEYYGTSRESANSLYNQNYAYQTGCFQIHHSANQHEHYHYYQGQYMSNSCYNGNTSEAFYGNDFNDLSYCGPSNNYGADASHEQARGSQIGSQDLSVGSLSVTISTWETQWERNFVFGAVGSLSVSSSTWGTQWERNFVSGAVGFLSVTNSTWEAQWERHFVSGAVGSLSIHFYLGSPMGEALCIWGCRFSVCIQFYLGSPMGEKLCIWGCSFSVSNSTWGAQWERNFVFGAVGFLSVSSSTLGTQWERNFVSGAVGSLSVSSSTWGT